MLSFGACWVQGHPGRVLGEASRCLVLDVGGLLLERLLGAVGALDDDVVQHGAGVLAPLGDILLAQGGLLGGLFLGQAFCLLLAGQLVDAVDLFLVHNNLPLFGQWGIKMMLHRPGGAAQRPCGR